MAIGLRFQNMQHRKIFKLSVMPLLANIFFCHSKLRTTTRNEFPIELAFQKRIG